MHMTKFLRHKSKKHKSRRLKTKRNKSRRHYKRKTYKKRRGFLGGNPPDPVPPNHPIPCAICNEKFPRNTMCVPSSCPSTTMPGTRRPYADRSHRVQQGCWFPSAENPHSAFARENESHICPGCEKGQPPNPPLQQDPNPEIVDLVSDSDEDTPPPIY